MDAGASCSADEGREPIEDRELLAEGVREVDGRRRDCFAFLEFRSFVVIVIFAAGNREIDWGGPIELLPLCNGCGSRLLLLRLSTGPI